ILDAIRDRDEALAVRLTEEHLRGSYERIVARHDPLHRLAVSNGNAADRQEGTDGAD
ncbi:MAG: hypothetical protein QOF33_3971, partial [Thermomicrobiales bacterium]|nr:hypothetical protein [Thermomicrobiales bacterium]